VTAGHGIISANRPTQQFDTAAPRFE